MHSVSLHDHSAVIKAIVVIKLTDFCEVFLFNVQHNIPISNQPSLKPLENKMVFILLVTTCIFITFDSRILKMLHVMR